jgi:ABC-2 type transport system permease protein
MMGRYARIAWCFARNGLVRELSFRANFILTAASEVLWLGLMLIFVKVIYNHTAGVQGWNGYQYTFLLGTHFVVTALFEAFFFSNVSRVSQHVRTGGLDFVLLKPVSAQLLLSLERIDYAALPNLPLGLGMCWWAARRLGVDITAGDVALYVVLVLSGVITLYSLMFMFSSASVWMVRLSSADHFWFYLTSCAKYPAEIFQPLARGALYFALTFVTPVLLVANLPASALLDVGIFRPWLAFYGAAAAIVLLVLSGVIFRFALRSYRSASS